MGDLAVLPNDILGQVLGFLPVSDIANARTTAAAVRTAADSAALWGVLVYERAGISGISALQQPTPSSNPPRALAKLLCLGPRDFDRRVEPFTCARWAPLLRCSRHGMLGSVPAALAELDAVQRSVLEAARGHRACDATPVAVTTILVPALDHATLALADTVLKHVLGVSFEPPTSAEPIIAEPAAVGDVATVAAGTFRGIPARFPSLSICRHHARRPLAKRSVANAALRQRCPADARRIVLLAAIPAATDTLPDDPEDWVDEPAVHAAAGRVLLAALACSSNVVCVNASRVCDWRRWHALLRRSTRCPTWDLPMLAARRDSACSITYIATTDAMRASGVTTGVDTSASPSNSQAFDPLLEVLGASDAASAASATSNDPANWFDYGLVNKASSIRGFVVPTPANANAPTAAQRQIDPEDQAAIEELLAAAGPLRSRRADGAAGGTTGTSAILPPEVCETIATGAGRPFLLLPLTYGGASGGLHTWPEVSAVLRAVARRAGNPAAGLDQLIQRGGSAGAFAYLPTAAARFYETAMGIEVDDAARPNETLWVDVARASRAITQDLDRAYATSAATVNTSTRGAGTASLPVDDDDDDNAGSIADAELDDASAGESNAAGDIEAGDLVPITPAELVSPGDVAAAANADPAASPSAAQTPMPADVLVPMDVEALLDAHEKYSVAALRQLVHSMGASFSGVGNDAASIADGVSVDVETGHELLEMLKTELSTMFRSLWATNQSRSRTYCEAIASRVFARIERQFTSDDATVLATNPVAPRQWYHAVRACIEEYVVRALGGRAFDVLAAHVVGTVIPEFRAACEAKAAPDRALADLCAASLENEVTAMHRRHMTERDTRLSRRQLTIAQLGVFVGSEWTSAAARIDLRKLQRDLNEDVAADWGSCTMVHHARLVAGGVNVPADAVWTQDRIERWVTSVRGHLEGRAREAQRAMHNAEEELGLRSAEAHNTSAVRERERRERAENATGVVRLFNMLRSPFANDEHSPA